MLVVLVLWLATWVVFVPHALQLMSEGWLFFPRFERGLQRLAVPRPEEAAVLVHVEAVRELVDSRASVSARFIRFVRGVGELVDGLLVFDLVLVLNLAVRIVDAVTGGQGQGERQRERGRGQERHEGEGEGTIGILSKVCGAVGELEW